MTRRALFSTVSAPRAKPNIVFILADDLGYGDLGCYGSRLNRTPHLDRLAAEGTQLRHHYSGSPVCSPARAALMTGLIPDRTGVTGVLRDDDDDTGLDLRWPTLAGRLRRQGYRTGLVGKWHLGMKGGYHPLERGFDEFHGFLNGMVDYRTYRSLGGGARGQQTVYRNREAQPPAGYLPDWLTAQAVSFIERQTPGSPWFLYLAHPLPHTPLQLADDRVVGKQEIYSGMVEALDATVGAVRQALEAAKQWDRTIVVFTSDNGWVKKVTPDVAPVGSNGALRGGKYELYEGGIRVPCIMRWPGVARGRPEQETPSWFPDWTPTLTGEATRDGRNLFRLPKDRRLYWRFEDRQVRTPTSGALRQGSWKWLRIGDRDQLFNLARDPGEAMDLATSEPGRAAEMAQAWQRQTQALIKR